MFTITISLVLGIGMMSFLRTRPLADLTLAHATSANELMNTRRNVPLFPNMDKQGEVRNRGIDIFGLDLGQASGFPHDIPGGTMKMRIFMPSIDEDQEHPPHSLGCVLIPAGGKNPFHGYSLLPDKLLEPLFPYAAQGLVVVHFSVDGALSKETYANRSHYWEDLEKGSRAFLKADGGLENAFLAYEFVRQKILAVNPQHIFIAGEFSAATMALQFVAQEPRIFGCVAMTPFVDLGSVLEKLEVPEARRDMFARLQILANKCPPMALTEKIQCRLLLTHVRELQEFPLRESRDFASLLQLSNKAVDYSPAEVIPSDPYYANMKYMNSAVWIRNIVTPVELPDLRGEPERAGGVLR
jgi:hypothetical protein